MHIYTGNIYQFNVIIEKDDNIRDLLNKIYSYIYYIKEFREATIYIFEAILE